MGAKKKAPTSDQGRKSKAKKALLEELEKVPSSELVGPTMPVPTLVAEALALATVAKKQREQLVGLGLHPRYIDELAERARLLADYQAELTVARGNKKSKADSEREDSAVALRSQMIADGRYALRKDETAQAVLDRISEGADLDDLVQDLKELATFFTKYEKELKAIKVPVSQRRNEATKLAEKIETGLAERRTQEGAAAEHIDRRNRAVVVLLDAMTEVREAGRYLFRDDPKLRGFFQSAYRRQHRGAKAKASEGTESPSDN